MKKNTKISIIDSKSLSVGIRLFNSIKSFRETTIIFIVLFVGVVLTILSPFFLTVDNLRTTIIGLSASGIVVVGMTIALISGGFDLSVGAVMGLAGIIAGKLFLLGINVWISAVIAILCAVILGTVSGFLIGEVRLNALITTLGIMGIARGACFVITEGTPLPLGTMPATFKFIGSGTIFGFPLIVIIFFLIAVTGDFFLRRSKALRNVFYVGSNEKTAELSGINVARVKMMVYVLVSFMAGLAGVLSMARFGVATPTAGTGLEMTAISSAVIGGASISGGEGTVLGSVLGIILLGLISNGLVLLSVSVYWQQMISGIILLGAVILDHLSNQKRLKQAIRS